MSGGRLVSVKHGSQSASLTSRPNFVKC